MAVASPVAAGRLVRFLSDQQGCVLWYLYLAPGGAGHAVAAGPSFYGTPEEMAEWGGPSFDPPRIAFCAETFETFLCRFWLENEIFFAFQNEDDDEERHSPPQVMGAYIETYKHRAAAAKAP